MKNILRNDFNKEMIVYAIAEPDTGHVALNCSTIRKCMELGKKVLFYSLDQPEDKMTKRIGLNDNTNLLIKDKLVNNLEEINNTIDSFKPDLVIIDYFMLLTRDTKVEDIFVLNRIAKEHNILFHCDTVQAVGKVKIDVKDMNIDTLSISGHKINAPKGIGVLYVKNTIPFIPLIFGHQEKNYRGGTENVPYIIGLGKAVELILNDNYEENNRLIILRDYMEQEIKTKITDVAIYGDLENRLPNTSSIAFKGVKADELLLMLESFNIFISTGSACNSEIALPSHVLTACNADLENYSPIRISLGKYNTKEEIDTFIKRLMNIVNMIRKRG